MADVPTFVGSAYNAQTYGGNDTSAWISGIGTLATTSDVAIRSFPPIDKLDDYERRQPMLDAVVKKETKMAKRRLVKVIIADPHDDLPLENTILYTGDEKLTDSTDQELFFEIPIKELLDAHNAKRVTIVNKKIKDRTEHLEPARIRDLKMVVVSIAEF